MLNVRKEIIISENEFTQTNCKRLKEAWQLTLW